MCEYVLSNLHLFIHSLPQSCLQVPHVLSVRCPVFKCCGSGICSYGPTGYLPFCFHVKLSNQFRPVKPGELSPGKSSAFIDQCCNNTYTAAPAGPAAPQDLDSKPPTLNIKKKKKISYHTGSDQVNGPVILELFPTILAQNSTKTVGLSGDAHILCLQDVSHFPAVLPSPRSKAIGSVGVLQIETNQLIK